MKLILFAGLPGTGKSTLAEALGRSSNIPVFALDWLLGALKPLKVLTSENAAEVGYTLIETLLKRQFMLNQSAILDSPAHTTQLRQRWCNIAQTYNAEIYNIETICSDVDVHRSYVEGRIRSIPGWHEITWAHVEKMRAAWESWSDDRLVVDAVDNFQENLKKVVQYTNTTT